MESDEVVAASLAALGSGEVVVIAGEQNRSMVKAGLAQQLESL